MDVVLGKLALKILTLPGVYAAVKAAVVKGVVAVAGVIASVVSSAIAALGPFAWVAGAVSTFVIAAYIIDNWDELEAKLN